VNYPLGPDNWICSLFGHRFGKPYGSSDERGEFTRRTCALDGFTVPPFRKVAQSRPYDYLPDDQQPKGAR
jgi:hypothetical protein